MVEADELAYRLDGQTHVGSEKITGWPVIFIAVVATPVCGILSRQFMAYGRGERSAVDFVEGRYFLGVLVIAAIGALTSAAITLLLGYSLTVFAALTAAFCGFGLLMLAIGWQRRLR